MSDGLTFKYFVLKPKGTGAYAKASQAAMRAYAESIKGTNEELSADLLRWSAAEAYIDGEA